MATLSYDDKVNMAGKLSCYVVNNNCYVVNFDEEIDIASKILMSYDNLADSAIVFSGITEKCRVFAQNACECLRTVVFARSMT